MILTNKEKSLVISGEKTVGASILKANKLDYLLKSQMQTKTQIERTPDPIKTFLQTRTTTQYLEDPYFIYLKPPVDKNWQDLEKLLEIKTIFYWYAFTFAGHNKLYNIIWGTVAGEEVVISGGCTYRIDSKAKLSILNAVKQQQSEHGYFYLGGGVRDRIAETMKSYSVPGFSTKRESGDSLNRYDLSFDLPDLDETLLRTLLEKIVDAIEHSDVSRSAVPQTCPTLNECFNNLNSICQLYHHGSKCFLDSRDRNYEECNLQELDMT
jgi:hypothetical protein